jgi:serine/threonine protein kinase
VSISVDRLLESVDTLDEFDLDEIEPTRVMSSFEDGFFFADRFKIDEVLGSGGMGTVYDAHDMQTGHRVALKVLKKTKSSGESAERFRREAEILASIDHPGIVGIHGFGAAPDGTLWLAMEYLEGVTLREKVSRDGPMDPAELCPIITAACAALSETHARGVVHRDLKPDNIFLTSSTPPEVKILDFGLSLTLTSKKLTATGTIIGTPRYMAPEQIKSAHAAGAQADVYALGVIAYECLAGQSPFVASDHGQLLGAILTGRTQPLAALKPDYPEALDACLKKAISPDVAVRYATPEAFAMDFADAASIHAALSAMPAPKAVRGKPTVRMAAPAGEREDATTRTSQPRFSSVEGFKPGVKQAAPVTAERPLHVPTWMIPLVVLGGAAIMAVGAAIAYWWMR